jgi:ligand-binding SRPBCC domain-containing protein
MTVNATPERCFDFSRDVASHLESTGGSGRERVVAGVREGLLELGDEVTFEARRLAMRWRMTSAIAAFDRPRRFVDEMRKGPFSRWRHEHVFEPHPEGTLVVDEVTYAPVLWPLSWPVDVLFLRRYMRRMLRARNAYLKARAESA